MQHGPSYLPSEGIIEDIILYEATAISSSEGETIALKDKVGILVLVSPKDDFSIFFFYFASFSVEKINRVQIKE